LFSNKKRKKRKRKRKKKKEKRKKKKEKRKKKKGRSRKGKNERIRQSVTSSHFCFAFWLIQVNPKNGGKIRKRMHNGFRKRGSRQRKGFTNRQEVHLLMLHKKAERTSFGPSFCEGQVCQ